jgi:hypothetical protein
MIWDIPADAVEWKDGKAYPAGPNAGSFEPLPLAEIALKSGRTGGPISAEVSINAQGAGPGFATHICDVEVDKETGQVKILRYTAVQDVGRAIHPSYVEGQIQGGVTQGRRTIFAAWFWSSIAASPASAARSRRAWRWRSTARFSRTPTSPRSTPRAKST